MTTLNSEPQAVAAREPVVSPEQGRRDIELRLTQLQGEDFVMPGWQTAWSDVDRCVMVMFQLCHKGMPEAMTEFEFRAWAQGWDARRAAVVARKPRPEAVRRP